MTKVRAKFFYSYCPECHKKGVHYVHGSARVISVKCKFCLFIFVLRNQGILPRQQWDIACEARWELENVFRSKEVTSQ